MWESLRLDSYSNGRLLYVPEMGVETWWEKKSMRLMLVELDLFGPWGSFTIT